MRVLIVDDEKETREIMLCIFRKKGLVAEAASSGREAIGLIARNKPDIIIFNLTLSEEDGFETGKQLNENPRTQDIPIIFLSAIRGSCGFLDKLPNTKVKYIEKPCKIRYLIRESNKLIADSFPRQPR